MSIVAHDARAKLSWSAETSLGAEGYYRAYGGLGAVSYAAPLMDRPADAWPQGQYAGAYGSGDYGSGTYGIGAFGAEYGQGFYGMGYYGLGCTVLTATTGPLTDGLWQFAVVGYDAAGNADPLADRYEATVTLAGTPEPPSSPAVTDYDAGTDTLELSWTLSEDDQG